MLTVLTMSLAFLWGGIPFGYVLGRIAGVDVRASGSGNIGATNVGRTAGRSLGLLTLVLDALKGSVAAIAGAALGGPRLAAGAGCAAVLGHVFSPYLGFRGGKGVATTAGVFSALAPASVLGALLAFAIVVALTRVVSLASLVAAAVLPILAHVLGERIEVVGLALAIAILVWVRHRSNLARLIRGRERPWGAEDPGLGTPDPPLGG